MGRFVGKITVNGVDANLKQIKAGLAWHYKKYADEQSEADRKTYSDAEIKARDAKLGFWKMPNMTPA
jgi:endonuclease YncB( thermonuclease family)